MHRKKKPIDKSRTDLSLIGVYNDKDIADKIAAQFSKAFSFTKPKKNDECWDLPDPDKIYVTCAWSSDELTLIKDELNSVKDLLSDKDIIRWRQHTHDVNFAGKVVPHVRYKIQPELCTQAWCKFYEILCSFPIIPRDQSLTNLNSVHLCEAPGAFVTALNHYLVLNRPHLNMTWLATTLNPYYEGNQVGYAIPDDRFIFPTIENWEFGDDNTGDIFSHCNRKKILEKAATLGDIHLVTADGSIDCQDNPSEQENVVAKLHLCEVITGLQILALSGCMVVKMFTCFEHTSICLLYLLNCLFQQIHIFKPGTSKRGNSELYIICINYLVKPAFISNEFNVDTWLEKIPHRAMFALHHVPATFLEQMVACCSHFKNFQVEAVREHLILYQNMDIGLKRHIERIKAMVVKEFLQRYAVAGIPHELTITRTKLGSGNFRSRPLLEGSFNERKELANLSWYERLRILETKLKNAAKEVPIDDDNCFNQYLPKSCDQNIELCSTFGNGFSTCSTSCFCHPYILNSWNGICNTLKEFGVDISSDYGLDDTVTAADILKALQLSSTPHYQFIACSASCQPLADVMQQNLNQSLSSDSGLDAVVKIVLGDLRYSSTAYCNNHYSSHGIHQYLKTLRYVLQTCAPSDNLLLLTDPLLTRVDVAILIILNQAFDKITLTSLLSNGKPRHLIICNNYIKIISKSLSDSFNSLLFQAEQGFLLEILPLSCLLSGNHFVFIAEEPFCATVYHFNCWALYHQTSHVMQWLNNHMSLIDL